MHNKIPIPFFFVFFYLNFAGLLERFAPDKFGKVSGLA